MTALTTLTRAQIKVFLREPVAVGFGLAFPAVLLLVIGNAMLPQALDLDRVRGILRRLAVTPARGRERRCGPRPPRWVRVGCDTSVLGVA